MRYPPGTGFCWRLSPGFQVVPLYVASATAILIAGLASVTMARNLATFGAATVFGGIALTLIDQSRQVELFAPADVGDLIAAAYLTILMFAAHSRTVRLLGAAIAGLLLGLSVNIRLANVLLGGGAILSVLGDERSAIAWVPEPFVQGLLFGSLFAIGLSPTLIANAVNVGHPFRRCMTGSIRRRRISVGSRSVATSPTIFTELKVF